MSNAVVRKGLSSTWYVMDGAEIVSRHLTAEEARRVARSYKAGPIRGPRKRKSRKKGERTA